MDNLQYALDNFLEPSKREEYVKYTAGNPYAEVDVEHFKDVSALVRKLWLAKTRTSCPDALAIAGLYHDFDRVFPNGHSNDTNLRTAKRAIDTKSIQDSGYSENEIKLVLHPKNCAEIFRDYNHLLPESLKDDASYLIQKHETGGERAPDNRLIEKADKHTQTYNLNEAAEVLCEADGASFFTVLIYSYIYGRSEERIREKIRLSYNKLHDDGRDFVKEINYRNVIRDGKDFDVGGMALSVIAECCRATKLS